ncbi:hypothetical protein [Microcystis aeruginosa]|uniref:hypothetical protein n=1 Tax=Microcystis aeruginosa TaxID=1126 RepID=UPI001C12C015|nr:hypothetical protein [Microcystis aeruginosa]
MTKSTKYDMNPYFWLRVIGEKGEGGREKGEGKEERGIINYELGRREKGAGRRERKS